MKIQVVWTREVKLRRAPERNLIYSVDESKLPNAPGVYVFARRYASGFEALYVGKANNIRGRVKGQFKNLPLMMHVKNAKSGERVLSTGVFRAKPGQNSTRCLPLIERALIRYFLAEGNDLVNKQGTRIRRHEIASAGKHPKRFIPNVMFLDRSKGE